MEVKNTKDEKNGTNENAAEGRNALPQATFWELYAAFFRVGILTFGGGIAMLPMLERECVVKHQWATPEQMTDYYALAQCTPGVIAVNTATFIGKSQRGVAGAIAATLGVISPSIVIILIIAMLLQNFASVPAVQHAFAGIRVAVCALMLNSVIKLLRNNVKDWLGTALAILGFVLIAVCDLSPVYPVVGAALVGIFEGAVRRRKA